MSVFTMLGTQITDLQSYLHEKQDLIIKEVKGSIIVSLLKAMCKNKLKGFLC